MYYTETTNFKSKTTKEHFEDIYCRINKLENKMLGIKKDNGSYFFPARYVWNKMPSCRKRKDCC